jgi:hypothetical protein
MLMLFAITLQGCCNKATCPKPIVVTPVEPVAMCELPPLPVLDKITPLMGMQCQAPAIFCLDQENAMRMITNMERRNAWRDEVVARCGEKPATQPSSP